MEAHIERLREDHQRLLRVLVQLDRDLQQCRSAERQFADALIPVINALHFIRGYPELWHHPLEDLLFRRLLELDVPCALSVERLLEEHGAMALQTASLLEQFEQEVRLERKPDDSLLDACYAYFEQQVAHQKLESENVFPVMAAFLGRSDWRAAEVALLATPADGSLQRHYQHLYHATVNGATRARG